MMTELRARGLERHVYLWSDDNLSTDYFWRFLSDADRELVATYPTYGRVCCFKGFNAASFAFNTRAEPALFERQFVLMQRLLTLGGCPRMSANNALNGDYACGSSSRRPISWPSYRLAQQGLPLRRSGALPRAISPPYNTPAFLA